MALVRFGIIPFVNVLGSIRIEAPRGNCPVFGSKTLPLMRYNCCGVIVKSIVFSSWPGCTSTGAADEESVVPG